MMRRRLAAALTWAIGAVTAASTTAFAQQSAAQPQRASQNRPAIANNAVFSEMGFKLNRESLTGGRTDWREQTVDFQHQFAPRKVVLGRLSRTERFGLQDTTAAIGGYLPLGERTTGFAEYSHSGTHRVLPRDTLHLQIARALEGGWGLAGGLKHVHYDSATVHTIDLTLERYIGNFRVAFTALPSRSNVAGSATSYRLQLGYYYGLANNVQIVAGDGTEVDKPIGINQVVATPVRSLGFYGRHWLAPSWALEYGAGETIQGSYARRSIEAGLRYRF